MNDTNEYFTTIKDAEEQYVIPALGEFASDYDTDAIAHEFFDVYDEHDGYTFSNPNGFFWIAIQHVLADEK